MYVCMHTRTHSHTHTHTHTNTHTHTHTGEVYTWGYGKNGRLGHGDEEDHMLPKRVEALRGEKINAVFAGFDVSAAVSRSGLGFRV